MDDAVVPDACPVCGRQLTSSHLLRPQPRWQPGAKLLLLLGGAISGPLVMLMMFFAGSLVHELTQGMGLRRREQGLLIFVLWLAFVAVALLPALFLAWIATRMAKTLTMNCGDCGSSQTYFFPARRRTLTGQAAPLKPSAEIYYETVFKGIPIPDDPIKKRLERLEERRRKRAKEAEAEAEPNSDFDFRKD